MEDKKTSEEEEKRKRSFNVKIEIMSWIKTILLALALAVFINNVVIVNAVVPSGSMENTIMVEDRIVAFRLSYFFSEPERGDIVIFRYPDNEEILYVKRVMGLPGDVLEIIDGTLYINGEAYENEEYLKEEMIGSFGPYTVPDESYFMLGDNRNDSLDSRFWQNKYVSKDKILGKVIFKYYKGFEIF